VSADAHGADLQADAAVEAGVDRSVITRIRAVARDGAIAALLASRPGKPRQSRAEASEVAELRAEVARLERMVVARRVGACDRCRTYRCACPRPSGDLRLW
jgi:hypothetical protein